MQFPYCYQYCTSGMQPYVIDNSIIAIASDRSSFKTQIKFHNKNHDFYITNAWFLKGVSNPILFLTIIIIIFWLFFLHINLSLRDIYPQLQSFPSEEEKQLFQQRLIERVTISLVSEWYCFRSTFRSSVIIMIRTPLFPSWWV